MKTFFVTSFFFLFTFFLLGTAIVQAQCPPDCGTNPPTTNDTNTPTTDDQNAALQFRLDNPFGSENDTIQELFTNIINKIILPIGGVLAVLAFIYSGFLYVTAAGDEKKISTAHKALLYTAIGTAILLGSWVISQVIETTINQLRN